MTKIVQAVNNSIKPECCTDKVKRDGCSIKLGSDKNQYLVIDMDHEAAPSSRGGKKCDYLFFGKVPGNDSEWFMPLELKKGDIKASQVIGQLQAGAEIAANECLPLGANFIFLPVVASGDFSPKAMLDLRKGGNKINFRGRKAIVRRIKCGESLQAALTKK